MGEKYVHVGKVRGCSTPSGRREKRARRTPGRLCPKTVVWRTSATPVRWEEGGLDSAHAQAVFGPGGWRTGDFPRPSARTASVHTLPPMTGANHHNGLKTAILMGGLWSLLLLFGWMLAKGTGSAIWLFIMPLIGVAQTAYSYWNSDKLAVRSMGAIEVTEAQQPTMYAVVRELSAASGQPMPRLYVAPTMSPNAFATGRDPAHAAVCCTQGILQLLNERELRGVLGHELTSTTATFSPAPSPRASPGSSPRSP